MAFVHGKNTGVLVDAKDLGAYFNNVDVPINQDTPETTTFGVAGGSRTYLIGLNEGSLSLAGFWDGGANAVDSVLAAAINGTGQVVTVGPEGLDAIGRRCKLARSLLSQYQVSSPVDGVCSISASFQADGGVQTGSVLHPLSAETTSGNGTSIDNAAASTTGGVGHLHVSAATAGPHVIKVQHSVDNSVWADLITFASVTGATQERVAIAGTVNRYTRGNHTPGGGSPSVTFATVFARRN